MCRVLTGFIVLQSISLTAQETNGNVYPQGYFRNPLAIPMNLSGNFGELRPNHYHMGLDLKTNARENLPVYAAADGYVARIKIEPGGFGRAIYINHPNGYTTLYAHLNNFSQKIEAYLKRQQYELESWKVMLDVQEGVLPVKKGDFIAYSGNTGGSQAPHLHFEIRRTSDEVNLNPLLFGFSVPDNTKPRILRLGVYDRTKSVHEQSVRIVPIKATTAGRYITTPATITVNDSLISFGVSAYDTHTGSSNQNGIYKADLFVDDQYHLGFKMDNISYDDTRYLNAHIDYRLKASGGAYIQHLSELPGYVNSIYQRETGNGVISLSDGSTRDVEIVVKDAQDNTSTLSFKVRYQAAAQSTTSSTKKFYPGVVDVVEMEECEFAIGERSLYDSVSINYRTAATTAEGAVSAVHTIGSSLIPLHDSIMIRIKPNRVLSQEEQDRTVMQWYSGSRKSVQKVEWFNGWASARYRDFGSFRLLIDNDPPDIVPIGFTNGSNLSKATRIVFTVRDNLDRFKNVRAELDGKWLRFTNDKGRNFIYRFDEKCLAGKHELRITAEDEAGNEKVEVYNFTR
jgi:hypothetical protein